MEGLQSCGAVRGCAHDLPDIQFQKQSDRLHGLSVSEDQSSEITIVTAEGDTVMLSSRQHSEAELLTYEHLSWTPCESVQREMQRADIEAEREVARAVAGDLNDQEMADIQALLKELGRILKAFLTGEDESETSLEAAGDLDRFESISAFKADFEYRVSLQYFNCEADQLAIRKAAEPVPGSPVELEAAGRAAEVLSPAPAAAAAGADQTAVDLDASRVEAEQTAAKMARHVHASGLSGMRRLKHFKKFLKNFLEEMLSNKVIDSEQAQRGQSVIEKFINALQKPAAAVEVRMSRVSLNLQYVSRVYAETRQAQFDPAFVEAA